MRVWRLLLALLLAAGVYPVCAAAATETERRAAVLIYRQAMHENGEGLALVARLLTERAARPDAMDADGLARLRERLLSQVGERSDAPVVPPTVPGDATDLVASLVARHAGTLREPPAPRLWDAWARVEDGQGLGDLVPYLRAEVRASAGAVWHAALEAAAGDEALAAALDPVLRELTGAGMEAASGQWRQEPPPMPAGDLETRAGADWRETTRSALASALAAPEDVDPRITARLRARWFLVSRDAEADMAELAQTGLWIGLRDNVPEMADGNPVPFLTALVAGAQRLAAVQGPLPVDMREELEAGLELLRRDPAAVGGAWGRMDTRLAAVRDDVIAELERAARKEGGEFPRQRALLLAEARLTLMDDDWEAYLMQPFREPIQQALNDCFPLSGDAAASCRARFEDWALEGAGVPEASGDVGGPFEPEYLLREMELNPWQRINYLRGYWRELLAQECSQRGRVRNALEWALASRAYLEVVRRAGQPVSADVAAGLGRLADAGAMLARDLSEFGACRAQGRGPLRRTLAAYATAVNRLSSALPAAADAYRAQALAPGADIDIDRGPNQATDFVPENLTIEPCGGTPSCGVSQTLAGSEALYRHFPAPYRAADQAGLGSLSICYDDVSWVDRRADPVRAAGGVMAIFHGRLSFRIRGRHAEGGEVRDVFVLRAASEDSYAYLFAPDRPEALADPCPQEFQGLQTRGELPESRGWLVPRRLTFLSGERTSPSRLFTENWIRGRMWLERFSGERGFEVERRSSGEDLGERLARHLAELRERRRAYLYERLLTPMPTDGAESAPARLAATAMEFAAARRALDAGARVLVPRTVMLSPALRGSLHGMEALLGPTGVSAWREAGRDPAALADNARERLERHAATWREQADRAEIAPFIARTLIALMDTHAAVATERVSGTGPGDAVATSPRQTEQGSVPFP